MKCPDCGNDLHSSNASVVDKEVANSPFIAVNYFCQWCLSYWRWEKGEPLKRMYDDEDSVEEFTGFEDDISDEKSD